MIGSGFSFGLGTTLGKVATRVISSLSYIKDNLKIYFDFKNTDLEHVGAGSANFDTTSSYINMGNVLDSVFSTKYLSISCWIYPEQDSSDFIFAKRDASSGVGIYAYKHSNDKMLIQINDASTNGYLYGDVISPVKNAWHHIAWTLDPNASRPIKVYVNGKDSGNAQGGTALSSIGDVSNSGNFIIGQNNPTTTTSYNWKGNLKNFAIWDRPLSESEIQNIMYKQYSDLQGSELTHLKGWWALESNSNDSTTNSNNGTDNNVTYNTTIYGNNTPIKPRGFDNAPAAQADLIGSGSASFDGSDDYIDCGIIDFNTDDISIVAWYKAGTLGAYEGIINNRDSSGTKPGIQIRIDDGGDDIELFTDCGSTTFSTKTDSFVPSTGVWTHVAATIDRSALQSLYINGALQATTNISSQSSADLTNADNLRIGRNEASSYFDGNIAQVGIWVGRVLTQEEIQSISQKQYSELTTSEKTNLTSWWGLDSSLTGQNQSIVLDENDTTTTSVSLNGNESALANVTGTTTTSITGNLTAGKLYKLVFTKAETVNLGYDQWREGGGSYTTIYATSALGAGTYTIYFRAVESQPLQWQSGGSTPWQGSITNISLEEYDGNPGVLK